LSRNPFTKLVVAWRLECKVLWLDIEESEVDRKKCTCYFIENVFSRWW